MNQRFALPLALVGVLLIAGALFFWSMRPSTTATSSRSDGTAVHDGADLAALAERVDALERSVRLVTAELAAPQPAQNWGPPPTVFSSQTPALPAPSAVLGDRPAVPGQASRAEDEVAPDPLEAPIVYNPPNPADVAGDLLDKYNALSDSPAADRVGVAALKAIGSREVVTRLPGQPMRSNVDCRSRICRYTATFANGSAAEIWKTVLLASMGSEFPRAETIVVPNGDGSATLWIYAARP